MVLFNVSLSDVPPVEELEFQEEDHLCPRFAQGITWRGHNVHLPPLLVMFIVSPPVWQGGGVNRTF